jgi:hypothetical protein
MGVLVAVGALAAMPGAGFGQAGPVVPPAEDRAPEAGSGEPSAPEARPPSPDLPVPPGVEPRPVPAPGMGGRDCEHERAPELNV